MCQLLTVYGRSTALIVIVLMWASYRPVLAQGTAFTYQGQLKQAGVPFDGMVDLDCSLWDADAGGNQVGATVNLPGVNVTNGLFTVQLDFGAGVFDGADRWLEISVNGMLLSPRQELTATPQAQFALAAASATDATLLNGQPAAFYQNASNLESGTLADARLDGTYSGLLTLGNAGNGFTGTFSGSGAGLTDLNAGSISQGLVAPAFGGTGLDTSLAAAGSLLNADGVGGWSLLGPGADSQVLTLAGGVPTWANGAGFALPFSGSVDFNGSALALTNRHASGKAIAGHSTATGFGFPQPMGVYGESTATNGRGVVGSAPGVAAIGVIGSGGQLGVSGSGYTGVSGSSIADGGRGVFGSAGGPGQTYGGYFEAAPPFGENLYGTGVYGRGNTGVSGESNVASGTGVVGSGYIGVLGFTTDPNGNGVYGGAAASTGAAYGVYGRSESDSGTGVFGLAASASGVTYGVYGESSSVSGTGVFGLAAPTNGLTNGVYGQSNSEFGNGVYGLTTAALGSGWGVYGESHSVSGIGVRGLAQSPSGTTFGGRFSSLSPDGRAVYGEVPATTGAGIGVYGLTNSTAGNGVLGYATASSGTTFGVLGRADSGSGWGVYALGHLGASGVKAFRIDHPDDPTNKYLLHYAAESPEVINFYSETVTLDERGEAVVELPHYFAKINTRPRYQLTAVGAPMPNLHVAEEIDEAALSAGARAGPGEAAPVCSFRIAGGAPGAKVSWEVKALRNDRWVQQHGAPVEVEKQDLERGTYQHPELYGQPAEMGMNYRPECDRPSHEHPSPPTSSESTSSSAAAAATPR